MKKLLWLLAVGTLFCACMTTVPESNDDDGDDSHYVYDTTYTHRPLWKKTLTYVMAIPESASFARLFQTEERAVEINRIVLTYHDLYSPPGLETLKDTSTATGYFPTKTRLFFHIEKIDAARSFDFTATLYGAPRTDNKPIPTFTTQSEIQMPTLDSVFQFLSLYCRVTNPNTGDYCSLNGSYNTDTLFVRITSVPGEQIDTVITSHLK